MGNVPIRMYLCYQHFAKLSPYVAIMPIYSYMDPTNQPEVYDPAAGAVKTKTDTHTNTRLEFWSMFSVDAVTVHRF